MVPSIDPSLEDKVDTVDMVPSYFLPISLGLSTSREHLFKHSAWPGTQTPPPTASHWAAQASHGAVSLSPAPLALLLLNLTRHQPWHGLQHPELLFSIHLNYCCYIKLQGSWLVAMSAKAMQTQQTVVLLLQNLYTNSKVNRVRGSIWSRPSIFRLLTAGRKGINSWDHQQLSAFTGAKSEPARSQIYKGDFKQHQLLITGALVVGFFFSLLIRSQHRSALMHNCLHTHTQRKGIALYEMKEGPEGHLRWDKDPSNCCCCQHGCMGHRQKHVLL